MDRYIVFQRSDHLAAARVALAAGAAEKLSIDAPGLVELGGDHVEASDFCDALTEDDVGAAASHIGSHCDAPALTGGRHDLGLLLVLSGVENAMSEALLGEHR
jgi:hypothetical protein